MKKIIGIMCVVFVACGGQGTTNPSLTTTDNGSYDQAEPPCTQHSDCYKFGHKFCVKGICVGDPQPDVTLSEVEEDAVENDANSDSNNGIGPWGEIQYAAPDVATDNGNIDNGVDPADVGAGENTEDAGGELQISGGPVCKMDSDCADGDVCTEDICNPESEYASEKGCVYMQIAECCLESYECQEGKCVGNVCTIECTSDSDCPGDYCSQGACYSGVCYYESTNECISCSEDTGCDDGNACTFEQCVENKCMYEPVECDGACDPGVGCLPTSVPECTEDSDCPTGFECLCSLAGCADGRCIDVTGTQPVTCSDDDPCTGDVVENGKCVHAAICTDSDFCTQDTCLPVPDGTGSDHTCVFKPIDACCHVDTDCETLQICDQSAHACDFDHSKFKCTIQCIDIVKIAVIWFANTSVEKLADEVFEATPAELCTWGWDNKPTFKFNCNNGASFWGYGDQATVTCNDPDFTITKDKQLGNQGVMVVQFDKQCQ